MIKKPYGQKRLIGFFEKALSEGSLNHAYIIEGDTGSGKKTIARYFAALSLCKNENACGKCPQCAQTEAGVNPDITVIGPGDKASVGVDQIRDAISTVSYRALHGGRKVYIIESADLLTVQAQNSLLKVIEEPPKDVIFFLLCNKKSQLLQTIVSRSQVLKLSPLSKEELSLISPEANDFQLTYANGNPGKLIKICEDAGFKKFRDDTADIIGRFFENKNKYLYDLADFFEQNKDLKEDVFNIFLYMLQDVMFKKINLHKKIVNSDKKDIIDKISQNTTSASCIKAIEAVLEAQQGMGKFANYNLAIENMLVQIAKAM